MAVKHKAKAVRALTTDEVDELLRDRTARAILKPADCYRPGNAQRFPDERDRFQLQFHRSAHITRCLVLGNGAGKTVTAGIEANWWATRSHPYQDTPGDRHIQIIWVAQTFKQLDLLRQQLERRCFGEGVRWNENKHRYEWGPKRRPTATLTIVSNDADWGAIQGINPHLVIIDEECDEALWQELQMRRRGDNQTRFVISATATKGKRWMYELVYKPWLEHHQDAGLTEDQAMRVQSHPIFFVWPKGGIRDNPVSTQADVDWYEHGVRYRNPMEKVVRLHGGFVDLNQAPVFDLEAVAAIEQLIDRPGMPGVIRDKLAEEQQREAAAGPLTPIRGQWYPSADLASFRSRFKFEPSPPSAAADALWCGGRLTVYELPRADCYYVMGCDFAQGLSTGDFDAAVVCRVEGERLLQAAEAEGRWGQTLAPHLFFQLGYFFNLALLVGEANAMGLGNLQLMWQQGYTYQYTRPKAPDARRDAPHDFERLGYFKNSPEPIQRLQRAVAPFDLKRGQRAPPNFIARSPRLIQQLRRYQWRPRSGTVELDRARDAQLTMGAPAGENDDVVSAASLCCIGAGRLPEFVRPEPAIKKGTLADVMGHQDVHAADGPRRGRSAFRNAKGV